MSLKQVCMLSGGRTSARMLRLLIDSIPDYRETWKTIFCNTGKERPETLDFVHEIETRWWAIVPDEPGNAKNTIDRYAYYAGEVTGIPLAVAVQDGMTPDDVRRLRPLPEVICVGGSTEWKWATAAMWATNFPRVHLLRCNSPTQLPILRGWGYESCDGTGWNRGDRKQTRGVEEYCRQHSKPTSEPLWPHVCRERCKKQLTFA